MSNTDKEIMNINKETIEHIKEEESRFLDNGGTLEGLINVYVDMHSGLRRDFSVIDMTMVLDYILDRIVQLKIEMDE